MLIIHANETLNTVFGKLNHHYFGWVEDAQGFVFMSGLVVGLVYGGRMLKSGYNAMRLSIWARIRIIYLHQVFLIIVFLLVSLMVANVGLQVPHFLLPYVAQPILFTVLSLLLLTGSLHMGILPMYIFFMMLVPRALRMLEERKYITYICIALAIWAITQTGLIDLVVATEEIVLEAQGHTLNMGIFFNIFGWQVLFFGGLLIGFLMASKRLKTEFLYTAEMRNIFFVCVALFLFYGVYDRIVFDNWLGENFSKTIKATTDRGNFSVIYFVTFIADLFIVVWLLGPGQTDPSKLVKLIATTLNRVVTFKPLVFLGQHSLHVFTAHVLLVYGLHFLHGGKPLGEVLGTMLILLCLGVLYGVAWLHAKFTERSISARSSV